MARTSVPSDREYDAHFAAIGRVAETWAQLEFHIDQAIWEFAAVEQMLGACITAQLIGINNRIRALSSLVKARNGSNETLAAIRQFGTSLNPLQQKRHRAVHDPRHIQVGTGQITRLQITADNSLVFGFVPEDIEKLKETREKIAEKVREFQALHAKIRAELDALPDTSQPVFQRIVPVKKGEPNPTSGP